MRSNCPGLLDWPSASTNPSSPFYQKHQFGLRSHPTIPSSGDSLYFLFYVSVNKSDIHRFPSLKIVLFCTGNTFKVHKYYKKKSIFPQN